MCRRNIQIVTNGHTHCYFLLQVTATSGEKLNMPLLRLVDDSTPEAPVLGVNFDPALVRLLRETKYFLLLKVEVPESAQAIFQHADTFRQQISSLDLICSIYNKIQKTILPVEKPLVQQKLDAVDVALKNSLEVGGLETVCVSEDGLVMQW